MGIFTDITSVSYPARHPTMFLVLKFALELGELDQTRSLRVEMRDQDGEAVHTLSMPFEVKSNERGKRPDTNFIIQLNDTVFPKLGSYEFCVYLDDEHMGDISVNANLVQPGATG
jgi:hypothetical protein